MVKLELSKELEGPQKATGKIEKAEIKTITPHGKTAADSFRIVEFTVGAIRGPIRDVLGSTSLKVSLAASRITRKAGIGRLAANLYGWNGESGMETDDFIGCNVEFVAEAKENEKGTFWEINRDSLGAVGHLDSPAVV